MKLQVVVHHGIAHHVSPVLRGGRGLKPLYLYIKVIKHEVSPVLRGGRGLKRGVIAL